MLPIDSYMFQVLEKNIGFTIFRLTYIIEIYGFEHQKVMEKKTLFKLNFFFLFSLLLLPKYAST